MPLENNSAKYYSQMEKEELINYCEMHLDEERTFFPRDIVAQMIEYAGNPQDFSKAEDIAKGSQEWYNLNNKMKTLVILAKEQT